MIVGAGKGKQYSNVLEKPLSKGKQEVSLSAFALLFSELVQYNQTQVDNIAELERRLEDAGYAVGARVLELLCHRDKGNRRETRLLGILSFVHSTVWKVLFGKVADSLEKGTEHEDEYMISEKELLVNRFISVPKDMGTFNCGAFAAGIVKGVLDGAGFPAVVTAHFVPVEGQLRPRTTILIKFAEEVKSFVIFFLNVLCNLNWVVFSHQLLQAAVSNEYRSSKCFLSSNGYFEEKRGWDNVRLSFFIIFLKTSWHEERRYSKIGTFSLLSILTVSSTYQLLHMLPINFCTR
ncbi:hypothetical protein IFM89_030322 [Coptis chinensis]|uniref:Trafficking protein particle complex subunit n=1 Tax=Coptis chinensis TaxID=261450 RepID=A0A835M2F6_9MAGN|nr:hypothetical protein IFM89_030322 [Coptis chinensis]